MFLDLYKSNDRNKREKWGEKIDVRLGRIYWIELMGKMHVFHFLSKFGYDLVSRILLLFIRDEIGWFSSSLN